MLAEKADKSYAKVLTQRYDEIHERKSKAGISKRSTAGKLQKLIRMQKCYDEIHDQLQDRHMKNRR